MLLGFSKSAHFINYLYDLDDKIIEPKDLKTSDSDPKKFFLTSFKV